MSEILTVVIFLLWVNGLPSLVSVLIGDHLQWPVDGGRVWRDGRPLFGKNKTIRGITASLIGGIAVYPLIGQSWWVAGLAALLAMAGDLLSSFIKRRSNFHSGKNVIVLDQIFEALLPLLFLHRFVGFQVHQIVLVLVFFIVIAYLSSRLFLYVFDRPIPPDYPRVVRSKVRFREWRACHVPLARWQTWFNLTSFLSDQVFLTWFFKMTGLYEKGKRNALEIEVVEKTLTSPQLPEVFDGYRILLFADLHLDGMEGIITKILSLLEGREYDLCLLAGDIRMKTYGDISECVRRLKILVGGLRVEDGVLGVLGNHDCIEMLPDFEDAGIVMLVNDSWPIEKKDDRIWILGVDDPHYYKLDDAEEAAKGVPEEEFSILLAHSPEAYESGSRVRADMYFCGHTHGGQVCLANEKPIFTNSRAPRFTARGEWKYGKMKGYTSRGAGSSSIPVRFNCPAEISIITLSRNTQGETVP